MYQRNENILYTCSVRFYEELNDFLPPEKRKIPYSIRMKGNPSVKNLIESEGVPHTEVDLILANGKPVDFAYKIREGDFISVYPVFESFDISSVSRLRERPLREPKFVLDVHLGKLARYLRLCGFDTVYSNSLGDPQIVNISVQEKRIILTRDRGILKRKAVTHGYWIRSQNPLEQMHEVMRRFDLYGSVKPFSLCMRCNGTVAEVPKNSVVAELAPRILLCYDRFYRCGTCGTIYWKGSHYAGLKGIIDALSCDRFAYSLRLS